MIQFEIASDIEDISSWRNPKAINSDKFNKLLEMPMDKPKRSILSLEDLGK